MSEEKRNKIAVAITVNAILLIFIIAVVVIAQIVQISVLTKRKNQLWNEYWELVDVYEEVEDLSLRMQYDEKLQTIALEYYKNTGKFPWDTTSDK